eukprot:Platyproteum_vivax@DN6328_c1_g1_i1.p1
MAGANKVYDFNCGRYRRVGTTFHRFRIFFKDSSISLYQRSQPFTAPAQFVSQDNVYLGAYIHASPNCSLNDATIYSSPYSAEKINWKPKRPFKNSPSVVAGVCEDESRVEIESDGMYTCKDIKTIVGAQGCDRTVGALEDQFGATYGFSLPDDIAPSATVRDVCPVTCEVCQKDRDECQEAGLCGPDPNIKSLNQDSAFDCYCPVSLMTKMNVR